MSLQIKLFKYRYKCPTGY